MPQFSCPSCDGLMDVGAKYMGTVVACPHCGGRVQIPGKSGAAPGPSTESSANAGSEPLNLKRRGKPPGRRRRAPGSRPPAGHGAPSSARSAADRGRPPPPKDAPMVLGFGLVALLCIVIPMGMIMSGQHAALEAVTTPLGVKIAFLTSAPLSLAAWIVGQSHRNRARAARSEPESMATLGWVFGIVGTVSWAALLLYIMVLFIIAADAFKAAVSRI